MGTWVYQILEAPTPSLTVLLAAGLLGLLSPRLGWAPSPLPPRRGPPARAPAVGSPGPKRPVT